MPRVADLVSLTAYGLEAEDCRRHYCRSGMALEMMRLVEEGEKITSFGIFGADVTYDNCM